MTTIKTWLQSIFPGKTEQKVIQKSIQDVILEVSEERDLSLAEILGESRRSDYVLARAEIAQRCFPKVTTNKSEIGRALNRDHATIIHYLDEIDLSNAKAEA